MAKSPRSSDLSAWITQLRESVTLAALNYEVWWTSQSQDTPAELLKVMNRYNRFFLTAVHAHFVTMLVSLYQLYETRKDTYNIPACLTKLRTDPGIDPRVLVRLDGLYAHARPLWKKVSILRNGAIAHRSHKTSAAQLFTDANISPAEVLDLMERTKELLNILSLAFDQSCHAFNTGAEKDFVRLLRDMRTQGRHRPKVERQ